MNKRFTLFFTLLAIVLMLSLSCASASDNVSYSNDSIFTANADSFGSFDEMSDVEIFDSEMNDAVSNEKFKSDNLSSSSSLSSSHTVSGSSFSDIRNSLENANSGDALILSGVYYDDNKQISIKKDHITIKGKSSSSKAILDAKGTCTHIFHIPANHVSLENIIFRNVNADVWGGAINLYGTHLTIHNCEFINNKAQVGAIVINDGSSHTIVNNCIFKNNGAIFLHEGYGGYGGAIDSHGSHGQIINCTFINNYAVGGGGAIFMQNGINNTIKNCKFTNNSAPIGGAFYLSPKGHNTTITNCNFINNNAEKDGGALCLSNITQINSCLFDNNYAENNGGAVYAKYYTTIINSNFTNNVAENDGGATYLKGISKINTCIFSENLANHNGGAVFTYNQTNFSFSNFTNNFANLTAGAINIKASDNIINSCIFNSNLANLAGTLNYERNFQNLLIKDSIFKENFAFDYGILCLNSETNVYGCIFDDNVVEGVGGVIFANSSLMINGSNFTNNTAIYGGAIYNLHDLNIFDSIFRFNSALNGSAIYNNGSCIVTSCVFEHNQANSYILNLSDYHVEQGEIININVFLEYGDNYFGIFNNGELMIDNKIPIFSSGAPEQEILLTINNQNYTAFTNSSGLASFLINTANFTAGNYSMFIYHLESSIASYIFNMSILEVSERLENTSNDSEDNSNKKKDANILTDMVEKPIMENQSEKKNDNIGSGTDETSSLSMTKDINIKSIDNANALKSLVGNSGILNISLIEINNILADFYMKFPFAINRSDSDLLLLSYIIKELSYNAMNYSNHPFINAYSLPLGLDLYTAGSFIEAYVLCNGSLWDFINYPYFHDPNYSNMMDSAFGVFSPFIKGGIEFAVGIDANGDMSIGQFLINILCFIGIGVLGKVGTRIITRLDKFHMFLKGSKVGIIIPNRFPNLSNAFNTVDVTIQLINKPFTGLASLIYNIGKVFTEKFGFSLISKGSKSNIVNSILSYMSLGDIYLNNLGRSLYNIISADFKNFPSNLRNLLSSLSKSGISNKRKTLFSKGNKAIYNKNKKVQIKNIKKVYKKVSKVIPKKLKTIIKIGIKKLINSNGISNKIKKNSKKLKTMNKNGKYIAKKVSTKIKNKTSKNRPSNLKIKKKIKKTNKLNKISKSSKRFVKQVSKNIKNKNNKIIKKVANISKKLIKRTLSFFK